MSDRDDAINIFGSRRRRFALLTLALLYSFYNKHGCHSMLVAECRFAMMKLKNLESRRHCFVIVTFSLVL
jgi:hypothetical protein